MSRQEGDRCLSFNAAAHRLIHRLCHRVQRARAEDLYECRLEERDLFGGHDVRFVRTVHAACRLLCQIELCIIAAYFRHDNVLMSALAAKTVKICILFFLPLEIRWMTWMGNPEGAVITQRQLLGDCSRRIEDEKHRTGAQERHILCRKCPDHRIRYGEDNDIGEVKGFLDRGHREATFLLNALHSRRIGLHQLHVEFLGKLRNEVIRGARAHLAARTDHSNLDLTHRFGSFLPLCSIVLRDYFPSAFIVSSAIPAGLNPYRSPSSFAAPDSA